MNLLLTVGLLLTIGYIAGWLLEKVGLPRIIAYIATGIVFSPHTASITDESIVQVTHPLLEISLAFIAFEIGGALKWFKIKAHEKEIISITLMASLIPFLVILLGVIAMGLLLPQSLPYSFSLLVFLGLLLGALASPTDPTATFAVMHQYKSRGRVSDTIVDVAAIDDAFGILLFGLTIGTISLYLGNGEGKIGSNPIVYSLYQIVVSIIAGAVMGFIFKLAARMLKTDSEGQWVVITFSLLILMVGLSEWLGLDEVLASMMMGVVVANACRQQEIIFSILERYTEELIFLFFFLLSGMQLNISTLPQAAGLIGLFVLLRTAGKMLGANLGARLVKSEPRIQKYTAYGLLPQGGIVIGLALSLQENGMFTEISELLLTTIIGTSIIHELIGPIAAKWGLEQAGEIESDNGSE